MTTETPWQLLGRIVRARREHLGLRQEELAHYGGPKVSTVGKIERAAQTNYPTRTQHQLENALGWKRGAFREVLAAPGEDWWSNEAMREDSILSWIEDNVPDLSKPHPPALDLEPERSARNLSDAELLAELTYRMKRYAEVASDADDNQQESDPDGQPPTTRAPQELTELEKTQLVLLENLSDDTTVGVLRQTAAAILLDPNAPAVGVDVPYGLAARRGSLEDADPATDG